MADEFAVGMQDLRVRFLESSAKTLDAFRAIQHQLTGAPDVPEALDALRRELHRVRGTAASYGFTEASRLAAEFEKHAAAWSTDPTFERVDRAGMVAHFVTALADALRAPATNTASVAAGPSVAQPVLLLAADDDRLLDRLLPPAALRGYRVIRLPLKVCDSDRIRACAARLVIARLPVPPALIDAGSAISVPVLGVETRPLAERSADRAPAGLVIADITDSIDPALEVAERLLLRTGWSGSTILAVDDDPTLLALIRAIFAGPEFHVETLDDPSRLMAVLDEHPPSLLLLDISMPGMNGIDLVRQLRARARFRDLPVILLSGSTDAPTRNAALQAGADEFIAKPVAPAELRARIADRLERQRLSRLDEGLHPATGLPLPDRLARDAERALAHLAERALPATVALIRLVGSAPSGSANADWLRETVRITRQLAPVIRAAGYSDGLSLFLVVAGDADETMTRLLDLVRTLPERVPAWNAGVVPVNELSTSRFLDLRVAAEDAVDQARRSPDEPVHRWRGNDALAAPDVILVEDDPALAAMIEFGMRSSGVTFRTFSNGLHALEHLLQFRTGKRRSIVLLDVDLPGLDGYSLHERLRAERPSDYDVVFMTVHGSESDQLRALKSGAIDYLPKPVNLRVLMAKLSTWIERARRPA